MFWGSTFGRVSGCAGAQTRIESEAQLQLPSLATAPSLVTSSPAFVCGFFVVSFYVWYADCRQDISSISTSVSWLLCFVHALGLALSVPYAVNCFSETKCAEHEATCTLPRVCGNWRLELKSLNGPERERQLKAGRCCLLLAAEFKS